MTWQPTTQNGSSYFPYLYFSRLDHDDDAIVKTISGGWSSSRQISGQCRIYHRQHQRSRVRLESLADDPHLHASVSVVSSTMSRQMPRRHGKRLLQMQTLSSWTSRRLCWELRLQSLHTQRDGSRWWSHANLWKLSLYLRHMFGTLPHRLPSMPF